MFEQKHSDLLVRFANRFGLPNQGDDHARDWTMQLAEQFYFTFNNEGWGTKRAGHDRPPSTDVIARVLNSRLVGYDTVINAGASNAVLNPHPEEMDINDQVFIPVNPVNHLGDDTNITFLGTPFFWAWGGMKKYPDQLDKNLIRAKTDAAIDYIRWFFTVGTTTTLGEDPFSDIGAFYDDPQHMQLCRELMTKLQQMGLKSHMTLVGAFGQANTQEKRDAIVDRAAILINEFPNDFIDVEMWNEYLVNGAERAWLRNMARRLNSQVPSHIPISLSSPDCVMGGNASNTEVMNEINNMYGGDSGANEMTIHNTRPEPIWRAESLRSIGITMKIIEGEPRGPGASAGGDVRDPRIIGSDYQSAIRGRAKGYTLHCMSGVWGGHCDPRWNDQNEWANIWEMPNWDQIAATLKAIRNGVIIPPIEPPAPHAPDKLMPGQRLGVGQRLTSPNGKFYMEYQGDGNLVIYETGIKPIWASDTGGESLGYLEMQADGNLVLYSATRPIRASRTSGEGIMIQLQDDGNLVMYQDGEPIWASMSSEFYS